MESEIDVVQDADKEFLQNENRELVDAWSRQRQVLDLLARSGGLPAWARQVAADASMQSRVGFEVVAGAPIPFPKDMHVLLIEGDGGTRDGELQGSPITWETNASAAGAPDLDACIRMGEMHRGKYGRYLVCKLVPVASSEPAGWVEVDRAGNPVSAPAEQSSLTHVALQATMPHDQELPA